MSVFDLAATGRLGSLNLGASLDTIIEAFGEPDHRAASDPSALIKYGDFELIFDEGLLAIVHCEFDSPPWPGSADGARLGVDSSELIWPVSTNTITSAASRAGLPESRSHEGDSGTASFGPLRLTIDHAASIAVLSIVWST